VVPGEVCWLAGVWVLGVVQDGVHRAALDDATVTHHEDVVADVPHRCEVMGDEQQRHTGVAADLAEQVEDLGLDRDVEGGDGLVEDEEPGRAASARAIATR